jgi:hypothetical protein
MGAKIIRINAKKQIPNPKSGRLIRGPFHRLDFKAEP